MGIGPDPATWFTAPSAVDVNPALHGAWLAAMHSRQVATPAQLPGSGAEVGAPILVHNGGQPYFGIVEGSTNALYPDGGAIRPFPLTKGYPITAWGGRADGVMPGDASGYTPTDNRAALTAASTFVATVRDAPVYVPGAARPYDVKGPSPAFSRCVWRGDGPARSVLRNTALTGTDFWLGSIVYAGTAFAIVGQQGKQSFFEAPYGTCDAMSPGVAKLTNVSGITLQAGDHVQLASTERRRDVDGNIIVATPPGGLTETYALYATTATVAQVSGSTIFLDEPLDRALTGGGRIHFASDDGLAATPGLPSNNPQWLNKETYLCCEAQFHDIGFDVLDWLGTQRNQTFHGSMHRCLLVNCWIRGTQNPVALNPGGHNVFRDCRFAGQWNVVEAAYSTTRNRWLDCNFHLQGGGVDYTASSADTYCIKTGSEAGGAFNEVIGGTVCYENDGLGADPDLAAVMNHQGYRDRVEGVTVYAGAKGIAVAFADGGSVRRCDIHGGTDVGVAGTRAPVDLIDTKFFGSRSVAAARIAEGIIYGNSFGDGTHFSHRLDVDNFVTSDAGTLTTFGNAGYLANAKVEVRGGDPVTSVEAAIVAQLPGFDAVAFSRESILEAVFNFEAQTAGTKSIYLELNGTATPAVTVASGGHFWAKFEVYIADGSQRRLRITAEGMTLPSTLLFNQAYLTNGNVWALCAATDGGNIAPKFARIQIKTPQVKNG